jgi:lipopolysaccharide cholinephosphotransferase
MLGERGIKVEYGTELRKVQLAILEIFKAVKDVCEENEINYFIICGTALGAVRHGGFIPWDDDLDIGMPREDYNKFLKVAPKKLPADLFLQTIETDPESIFYYAKVRKTGTKFIEMYCKDLNMHQGVFIDIFPFDHIPDSKRLRKIHYMKVCFWVNLLVSKCVSGTSKPQYGVAGWLKRVLRKSLHFLLKPVSKGYLYKKVDLACRQYNSSKSSTIAHVRDYGDQIPLIDVKNTEKIIFEGIEVSCPGHVEEYLRQYFGDYLKLPPIKKRVGHRPYILEV